MIGTIEQDLQRISELLAAEERSRTAESISLCDRAQYNLSVSGPAADTLVVVEALRYAIAMVRHKDLQCHLLNYVET